MATEPVVAGLKLISSPAPLALLAVSGGQSFEVTPKNVVAADAMQAKPLLGPPEQTRPRLQVTPAPQSLVTEVQLSPPGQSVSKRQLVAVVTLQLPSQGRYWRAPLSQKPPQVGQGFCVPWPKPPPAHSCW